MSAFKSTGKVVVALGVAHHNMISRKLPFNSNCRSKIPMYSNRSLFAGKSAGNAQNSRSESSLNLPNFVNSKRDKIVILEDFKNVGEDKF